MKNTKPLVTFSKVRIGYDQPLLESFSLDVHDGDFLSIVGSNGSGKTTLLRTLLGLISPLSGQIKKVPELTFGYVPQRSKPNLGFPLTVEQVVMLGRTKRIGLFRKPGAKDYHAVIQALTSVGIEKLATRFVHQLSGGQYQRTLIARALASEPNILVLDEPTTGMDIVAEHSFLELVQRLKEKHKLTVIMVTHDLSAAAEVSDSLIIINGRDQSVSVGPPMEVLTNKRLSTLFHRPLQVVKNEGRMTFIVGASDELTDPTITIPKDET